MTTIQYVALMLHWFGDGIATHPGLEEPQYQEALKVLLPMTPAQRREYSESH